MSMKTMMITSPLQYLPGYRSTSNNTGGTRAIGLQALLLADTCTNTAAAASSPLIHPRQHTNDHLQTNDRYVITKSLTAAPPLPTSCTTHDDDHLLLQSCHFCSTKLSPQKDLYMYRGDQKFCSRQCRDKQMKLDEIKEMEESTLRFHLKNSYNSSRRRRQLKSAPLLEISSSTAAATASRRQGDDGSIPRRRYPISQYYNRPLPLPPHQRRLRT